MQPSYEYHDHRRALFPDELMSKASLFVPQLVKHRCLFDTQLFVVDSDHELTL